jgi:hypothetical protein
MCCPRCKGLMDLTRFYDLLDDTGSIAFDAWRCICCGEVLDSVVYMNRTKRPRFTRLRKPNAVRV